MSCVSLELLLRIRTNVKKFVSSVFLWCTCGFIPRVKTQCQGFSGAKLNSRFWWDLHLPVDHRAQRAEEDNPLQHHQPPSPRPTSVRFSGIPSVSPTPAVHPRSCCELHQSSDCCTLAPEERDEIRTMQVEIRSAQVTVQTQRDGSIRGAMN